MGDLDIDSPCFEYPYGFIGWQKGSQGSQGTQGRQGRQGGQGPQGNQGNHGNQGIQGSNGVQGAQGNQGNQGLQGFQGDVGAQGASGEGCCVQTYWFNKGGSDLLTPVSTGNDITFVDSNPDTITRLSGDFVADGWVAGQRVVVSGASQPGNNATFAIANVTTNILTLSSGAALDPEGTGADVTLLITDDRFIRLPPTDTEQDSSAIVTIADTNGVPINNYITITGIPGELSIPEGTWKFDGWFWATGGTPTIKFQVCKRDVTGATTVLFTTAASVPITALGALTAQEINLDYVLGSPITLAITDRIVVRVLAFSDTDQTVHFIYDDWSRASNVITTFNSHTYANSLPTPITVGGITSGSTFLDIPLVGMWDTLLYPELFPTLTNPNNSFSLTQAGLREIGEFLPALNFTAGFNRGSINPAYGTSGFRSGLPNTYNYTGTGLPAAVPSVALANLQAVLAYTVLIGSQAWTNTVAYDGGEQPKSNKGNSFNVPLPAGTTAAKTVSIVGVYPFFATTAVITVMTKQPLALMNSAYVQTDMVAEDDLGNKQTTDFPTIWSAITGIQFYNTVSGTWEWLNGTKANSLTNFTVSGTTHVVQGNVINYNRYTNNSSKIGARSLRWYTT